MLNTAVRLIHVSQYYILIMCGTNVSNYLLEHYLLSSFQDWFDKFEFIQFEVSTLIGFHYIVCRSFQMYDFELD